MPRLIVSLAVAVMLAAPLAAQDRDTTRLPELSVTATRTPVPLRTVGSSADVLTPRELERRQIGSLRAALQLLPGGLSLPGGAPGAVASLFLRGASSTQTLFLLDGIRINDANTSYASFLGGAELEGLGRIEVVRGPQSTLYGGAAIGGVVSMDADAGDGPPRARLSFDGGTLSTWGANGSVRGSAAKLGYTFAASANGTDNERPANDWDQRTQLVRLDFRAADRIRLGATFRGMQSSYSNPGDIRTTNTTPLERSDYENLLVTTWAEARAASWWSTRLLLGGQEQFSRSRSRFDGGPEDAFTVSNSRWVLDWQNTFDLSSRARLVAGLNREWSTVWTGGASGDERLFAGFGEAILTAFHDLTLTAGVRGDDYSTFASAWTWRMTGAWRVRGTGMTLRGSYGTGFMAPSLAARYGSVFQNPNPGIRAERSRGWDAGIDQVLLSGRASAGVTVFRNSFRDLIGFESAPFPQLGRNINIDRARATGVELRGTVVAGPVDARVSYTRMSAKSLTETDPSRTRLIRRPRHSGSADVLVSLTPRTTIGAGVAALGNREDTDFNSFPSVRVNPGDFALIRLYASQEVGPHLVVKARVENLADQGHEPVYGFPGLGRTATVTLSARF